MFLLEFLSAWVFDVFPATYYLMFFLKCLSPYWKLCSFQSLYNQNTPHLNLKFILNSLYWSKNIHSTYWVLCTCILQMTMPDANYICYLLPLSTSTYEDTDTGHNTNTDTPTPLIIWENHIFNVIISVGVSDTGTRLIQKMSVFHRQILIY